MLKQRVITAVILITVFGGILFFAPIELFCAFLGLVLFIAAWEWANLCSIEPMWQRFAYAGGVICMGLCGWWALGKSVFSFWSVQSALMLACFWWALALLWVQGYPSSIVLWRSVAVRMIMGVFVLLPTWLAMVVLRTMPSGAYLVLTVVLIVAAADTGAYFSGRAFGKRKLAAKVSPGKSWEGVLGGLLAVASMGGIFVLVTQRNDFIIVLAILVPTAFVSVLGDLLESMMKRHRGVKDSSQLLPGHGGVLDRIDGLVAAVPIFTLAILSTGWQW